MVEKTPGLNFLLKGFREKNERYILEIESILSGPVEPYEEEYKHLINWLVSFRWNPYVLFANQGWASSLNNAESFSGLLSAIHHAMVDDGDICFPVVNGSPRIAFVWKNEDNVEKYVCMEREKGNANEISFLKDAYEFTAAYDEYQTNQLRKCVKSDLKRFDKEFVLKNYSYTVGFNKEWVDDPN